MPDSLRLPFFRRYECEDPLDPFGYAKVEVLGDENYMAWQSVLNLLLSTDDIRGIVNGKTSPPAPVEVLKTASANSPEGLYWHKRRYAWHCIYQTLTPYDRNLYCEDSNGDCDVKKLWDSITERERSKRSAWDLRTKLTKIQRSDFEQANFYMIEIDAIIWELQFVNSKEGEVAWEMAPDERTFWYLHGLPEDEDWGEWVIRTKIEHKDLMYKPKEMFQHIWRRDCLLHHERERTMNIRCYKCREMGHIRRNCPN